jgi:signal transduction histidine kinase
MNEQLQNILDFIQQNETISAEEKSILVKEVKKVSSDLEIAEFKLERTEKVKRTTAILLEETIEELEQKRKAVEAQNRDLEIESSLERVRTVAMGMRKPDDMLEVCRIISQQSESLGIKEIRNVQTAIIYKDKGTYLNYEYYAKHEKLLVTEVDYKNHELQSLFANRMLQGAEELFAEALTGKEVSDWYEYQKTTNQFADSYLENAQSLNYYFYSLGPVALGISTYSPLSVEEINLFKRFRNVFDLAYRRFLDIEQAEAQAREAKIEASLERVRAQALSMRKPDDLTGICEVLFTELSTLGFSEIRNAMINIHDDEKASFVNYDYSDEIGQSINHLQYNIHPLIEKQIKQVRSAADAFSVTSFEKKDLADWIAFRKKIGEKDDPRIENTDALYYYFYSIGTGSIGISTFSSITEEKLDVLKRFRNVFDFAYRRYTDVAQAEAQAREARIEAALERIRSRALSMHNSSEVGDVSDLLFSELEKMDINPTGFSIMIFDRAQDRYELWRAKEVAHQGVYETLSIKSMYDKLDQYLPGFTEELESKWNSGSPLFIAELSGKRRISFIEANREMGNYTDDQFENVMRIYPDPIFWHLVFFKHGWIGLIQNEQLPAGILQVIRRFADVFEFAHTRFLDLQRAEVHALQAEEDLIAIKIARQKAEDALSELQLTQKQLIQSEKMASLGELTAGIAHEIQNPLNFVNNFSEVSNEMIDEMWEEIDKGDMDEAKAIASDVKLNLEKILHHGKRADAIVKGMLQHSRNSSGVKEPTDINALADEYLRLAYHGLRAKDKGFNATLKTDFDETIGKIDVIPQDIGRVILNLITNAFYAVDEKKKFQTREGFKTLHGFENYEPTVTVSTVAVIPPPGGQRGVIISVKDNGPGIPPKVLDKIFQPFFTTKPTGQGTGLGLSLAYDIVKAHGGELKVETKEGTSFIIQIPL